MFIVIVPVSSALDRSQKGAKPSQMGLNCPRSGRTNRTNPRGSPREEPIHITEFGVSLVSLARAQDLIESPHRPF